MLPLLALSCVETGQFLRSPEVLNSQVSWPASIKVTWLFAPKVEADITSACLELCRNGTVSLFSRGFKFPGFMASKH